MIPDHISRDGAPLLRTLSPALRGVERSLRGWLDGPHKAPLSTIHRATFEGCAADLQRQADALDVERPLLVIMLMGGTGVGKSSLLNALAGGSIAQASFTRPTTRDPVVYYHQSIRTDRLDPALRHCRLVPHDRPALEQKILVDTPDVDSTVVANRDKLVHLLPVADVVIYVGSQEKYHDEIGWELFLQQRKRRAFAFVLNKWDRCLNPTTTGLRPDEDWLRDLKDQGFESPLLFRTCAQHWVDKARASEPPAAIPVTAGAAPAAIPMPSPTDTLPEGEQFLDLVHWLEMGLSRLEIEAIKARGVGQLLRHLEQSLQDAQPPDLVETAERVRTAWAKPLGDDAEATSEVLLNTLEPNQREIEHHFALEGQRRFHGPMAWYLQLFTRVRYVGSSLRARIPYVGSARGDVVAPAWDLSLFTRACSDVAANRQLDARNKALANHLLVEADAQGFPVPLLTAPVEATARIDWKQRYAHILQDVLQRVERQYTSPSGARGALQSVIVLLADWLPTLAFLATSIFLLLRIYNPWGWWQSYTPSIWDLMLPFMVVLIVLMVMHLLIASLLPLRWNAIRGEFQKQLTERLHDELEQTYGPVVTDLAQALLAERKQVEKLVEETREVASWLERREQSMSVAGLYGN
jgi:hypothetical protein